MTKNFLWESFGIFIHSQSTRKYAATLKTNVFFWLLLRHWHFWRIKLNKCYISTEGLKAANQFVVCQCNHCYGVFHAQLCYWHKQWRSKLSVVSNVYLTPFRKYQNVQILRKKKPLKVVPLPSQWVIVPLQPSLPFRNLKWSSTCLKSGIKAHRELS